MSVTTPGQTTKRTRTRAADAHAPTLKKTERREALTGALMVSPSVILLIVFFFIPVILAFVLAFTNARLISPSISFVGLDNFTRLFQDPLFWKSLRNTLYFAVVVVPLQSGFALLLALLVNVRIRGTNFFRTLYFVPVVTSIVVVSILWQFMYQEDGLINSMLSTVTGGWITGTAWLQNAGTAMPAIMLLSIWQAVGFHMVIWLAGLQTIPEELYEAARMDGAGRWHSFRWVTWPGLRPTFVFVVVTITIAALGLFVQIDVMTQGGPLDSTTTIIFHAVQQGFRQQEVGYGAALSLIFFVLVLAVSLIQRRLTQEKQA
jgi:multiple sugar transport system permease protein